MSVLTLTGSNTFLLQQAVRQKIADFEQQFGDFAVERIDVSTIDTGRFLEALGSAPFLSSERLVVAQGITQNSDLSAAIAHVLAGVSEGTTLLLVEPKLDKRGLLYKTLKQKTEYLEFGELDERQLATWASAYAGEQQARLSISTARALIARVGMSQELLAREIEKLALYSQDIDQQTIEVLTEVSPQVTAFELIDALFRGDTARASNLYDSLRELREEPQKILGLIIWQAHALVVAKLGVKENQADLAKQTGVSAYTLQKSAQLTRKQTLPQLRKLIRDLLDLDISLKTTTLDADESLRTYIATAPLN